MERKAQGYLHLVLKKQWYEMIVSGKKTVEYRDITDYYCSRLVSKENIARLSPVAQEVNGIRVVSFDGEVDITHLTKGFSFVAFHCGYTSRSILCRIRKITIGMGNPEWGAPTDRPVFMIYFS